MFFTFPEDARRIAPSRSTGLNGEMNTYADLDAEIESVECTLTMCREGGFMGLTAAVEREIAEHMPARYCGACGPCRGRGRRLG
jgi:hypothetical protein